MEIVTLNEFAERCKNCNPATSPQEAEALLQEAAKVALMAEVMKKKFLTIKHTETENRLKQADEVISHALELADKLIKADKPAKLSSIEKPAPKAQVECNKYGEYQHVLLTKEQYSKLVDTYGAGQAEAGIRAVDEYCQQHGKTYKDYNLTIRKFLHDGVKVAEKQDNSHSYDLNALMEHAMYKTPEVRP